MKTGVELITEERQKQIDKHGFTGKHHAMHPELYEDDQLIYAAHVLSDRELEVGDYQEPDNWDADWFDRLVDRPYLERLTIAGALIAAEIDRLQNLPEFGPPNLISIDN